MTQACVTLLTLACWNCFSINGILNVQIINSFSFNCTLTGKDSLTALAVEAAKRALEMAQVDPDEVDLVLMCTSTPEDLFGSAPQV